jgi:sodium-dependent phosphate cotransporter
MQNVIILLVALYVFLFSINLLGHSFKLLGKDFAVGLLETTSHPFLGLFLGITVTSLIQSSSTTTSIVVGLVAAGGLSLSNAIPVIMGANIGTTVTNILVSFGHATRRAEFRRAFSAAIVHDIFNVLSVLVLFPLELLFHPIEKTAVMLQSGFAGMGGMSLFNPIKYAIDPAVDAADLMISSLPYTAAIMIVLSLLLLFLSLATIVKRMRSNIIHRAETAIDRYLAGKDYRTFLIGAALTVAVQSSSVTTSLIVPLAGAGLLTTGQVYPFTLGANIGTTITSILAALGTGNAVAVMAAFSHLTFNVFGILIFYPLRKLPISMAERVGVFAGRSARNVVIVIACFIAIYLIPLAIFIL